MSHQIAKERTCFQSPAVGHHPPSMFGPILHPTYESQYLEIGSTARNLRRRDQADEMTNPARGEIPTKSFTLTGRRDLVFVANKGLRVPGSDPLRRQRYPSETERRNFPLIHESGDWCSNPSLLYLLQRSFHGLLVTRWSVIDQNHLRLSCPPFICVKSKN
jgi:hypothetical protein